MAWAKTFWHRSIILRVVISSNESSLYFQFDYSLQVSKLEEQNEKLQELEAVNQTLISEITELNTSLNSQPENLEIDYCHLVEENENLRKEIKVFEARISRLQNEKSAQEQENEGFIQLCVSADLL